MSRVDLNDLPSLNVSAYGDGDDLVVSLTDCRSTQRHGRGPYDGTSLARWSRTVGAVGANEPRHAKAARALYEVLFPGAVGEFLRKSKTRTLNLQFAAGLDGLAWEFACDGMDVVGDKFRVSRHLSFDEDGAPSEAPPPAPVSGLSVLQFDPSITAMPTPGLQPPRQAGAFSIHRLPLRALLSPRTRELLAQCDVLRIGGQSLGTAIGALRLESLPSRPRLLVGALGEGSERYRGIKAASELGTGLLDTESGSFVSVQDPWFVDLCDYLAAGMGIGEAVRKLRRARKDEGDGPIRLYGSCEAAIAKSGARLFRDHEKRPVTSLSFDVVDSTGVMRRGGNESYADFLPALLDSCMAIIREHGGVTRDPQGNDGSMSYFGYPVASERGAERAVSAGLSIVQAATAFRAALRVGIATGAVAVKGDQLFDESIHLAARLQKAAAEGTVLVSNSTRVLVQRRFELQALAKPLLLKGLTESQAAYQVVRALDDAPPQLTPFVGRETELSLLDELWGVGSGRSARVAVVAGEVGIGKSRLVREFRQLLKRRNVESLICHCSQESIASAFHALGETLRRLLDLRDHDDAETLLGKIARGVPAALAETDAVRRVADLLGIAPGDREETEESSERVRRKTLSVLVQWFCHTARETPFCLIVEDVHWIDHSTREFLEQLLQQSRQLPILVVMTLRTESDPGWRPPLVSRLIELRGLPKHAARWLFEGACGDRRLPSEVVHRLADRGDGVPLFLEESARMAVELAPEATDDPEQLQRTVPGTLESLLTARLDRLGPAKLIAQLGAVLGREFPHALLQTVLARLVSGGFAANTEDLSAHLELLENTGLLRSTGTATERRYLFKHALIQETAYQSLWGRHRQDVHRVVVEVLQDQLRDIALRQPELLARHLAEAGSLDRALEQWQVAARSAASRSAHHESISHLFSALDLLARLAPGAAKDQVELRLQRSLASRYVATEGYGSAQVERAYARAAVLCDTLGDSVTRVKVDLGLEGCHFMRADFDAAQGLAERALEQAARSSQLMLKLQAKWSLANIVFHRGDGVAAVQLMDECLAVYRPEMHRRDAVQDPGVMCLCYSAWGQWELGHPDDALRRIEKVTTLALDLDHKFSLAEAYAFATNVHHYRGETDTALVCAEKCLAICDEGGFLVWLAHARVMHGRLLCERHRITEGIAEMREGHSLWVRTGAVVTLPFYLSMLAEGVALDADPEQGLALLAEALQLAQKNGERYFEAEVRRLTAQLTLQLAASRGKDATEEAEHWLLGAQSLALEQQKLGFALRSGMALARLWQHSGRRSRAVTMLKPLMAHWTEGHHTRDLRDARRVLASLEQDQTHGEER